MSYCELSFCYLQPRELEPTQPSMAWPLPLLQLHFLTRLPQALSCPSVCYPVSCLLAVAPIIRSVGTPFPSFCIWLKKTKASPGRLPMLACHLIVRCYLLCVSLPHWSLSSLGRDQVLFICVPSAYPNA